MNSVTGSTRGSPLTTLWQSLFGASEGQGRIVVRMQLARRGGRPFMLLPLAGRLAAESLALYAPQTAVARLAKGALRVALRTGLAPLSKCSLGLARGDAFLEYLRATAGVGSTPVPPFAMLAGNPRVAGQRFLFLLFDPSGHPSGVVKAGTDAQAIHLIEAEARFLKQVLPASPGVPRLRSSFVSERVRAFATDFFPGDSPSLEAWRSAESILSPWIETGSTRPIGGLEIWRRLETSVGPALPAELKQLASVSLHPCLYHGDFAPWNIKARGQSWTVLDWERGELTGLPLWDWLHFVTQSAVLVKRKTTGTVLDEIEGMLASNEVSRYAERAGIGGLERPLTLAYLHYCLRVVCQTEGLDRIQSLANAARQRWFPS